MGAFVNDAIYNDLNTDATADNDVDMVFNNAGGLRADILTRAASDALHADPRPAVQRAAVRQRHGRRRHDRRRRSWSC